MRMLNSAEMTVVSGGDGPLPPCPPCPPAGCPWGDDVVIPGRPLPPRRSPNATTGAFDPIIISGSTNLQLFALSWQAQMDAEALLMMEAGRPGAIDASGESSFDQEWVSMMGPNVADSDRATYFAKWFETASKNELATLKGAIDTLKNTLIQANKVGFSMTIANLNAMSNNLRDAISGAAPAGACGWSFGIDVSNLHREAPHDLMRLAGWKAILNLWPSSPKTEI